MWLFKLNIFRFIYLEHIKIKELQANIKQKAYALYKEKEELFGTTLLREVERVVLLKNIDNHWMDHIDGMEELKKGIRLRAYAQQDPVIEYRTEGFAMFDEMVDNICADTIRVLLTFKLGDSAGIRTRDGGNDPDHANMVMLR